MQKGILHDTSGEIRTARAQKSCALVGSKNGARDDGGILSRLEQDRQAKRDGRGRTRGFNQTITSERTAKIYSNAAKATKRYKRKVFWAPEEDMRQEAIVAQLKAAQTFDPSKGTFDIDNYDEEDHFGAFTWGVAVKSIKRFLCKMSAPVSAQHRVDVLKGILHEPLFQSAGVGRGVRENPELPHETQTPEIIQQQISVSKRVRERLWEILTREESAFAVAVFQEDVEPIEIAEFHGVDPQLVYKAISQIKKKLSRDSRLFEIWREV